MYGFLVLACLAAICLFGCGYITYKALGWRAVLAVFAASTFIIGLATIAGILIEAGI